MKNIETESPLSLTGRIEALIQKWQEEARLSDQSATCESSSTFEAMDRQDAETLRDCSSDLSTILASGTRQGQETEK